ncbi:MAG: hypothetical protein HYX75_02680 [Acidobacteria bacterium]|nr:hypothetical protein [Acidobacteriota bacterium]
MPLDNRFMTFRAFVATDLISPRANGSTNAVEDRGSEIGVSARNLGKGADGVPLENDALIRGKPADRADS